MRVLKNANIILLKAVLFVMLGSFAAVLLYVQTPTPKTLALTGLTVWAFARAYYFAFYVIEKYVDPSFRFSGLFAAARYLWRARIRASQP